MPQTGFPMGGGSGGTLTSVGITSTTLRVAGSPLIANGSIDVQLPNLTGILYGNGTLAASVATQTQIAAAVGTLATANGGTGLSTIGTAGQVLTVNAGATGLQWSTPGGGSGTVTSVGVTSTTLSVSGGPITSSGNIGVNLPNITGLTFANGASLPTVATAAQVAAALSTQNISGSAANVTGTVAVANGGTGVPTLSGLAYGNGTGAMTAATAAQVASALGTQNISGSAANVTGTVATGNGGTGLTTIGTAGQVLTVNSGATALQWSTPTGGSGGVTVLDKKATASSITGTTTDTALYTLTIPANTLGLNGGLRITSRWTYTNNADVKNLHIRLGGMSGTDFFGFAPTTTNSVEVLTTIQNRGSASQQLGDRAANSGLGSSTAGWTTSSIDTTVNQTLVLSGALNVVGDTITLESVLVEVF